MWFMGDDERMHPVESCMHEGRSEFLTYMSAGSWLEGPRWLWCGLCGGVYR